MDMVISISIFISISSLSSTSTSVGVAELVPRLLDPPPPEDEARLCTFSERLGVADEEELPTPPREDEDALG